MARRKKRIRARTRAVGDDEEEGYASFVEYDSSSSEDDGGDEESPPPEPPSRRRRHRRDCCCRLESRCPLKKGWEREAFELLIGIMLLLYLIPSVLQKHPWLRVWDRIVPWFEWATWKS